MKFHTFAWCLALLLASVPSPAQTQYTTVITKTLGGCCTHVDTAINDHGMVTGYSVPLGAPSRFDTHVILWSKPTGTVDTGVDGYGTAINNNGDVVGQVFGSLTLPPGGFVRTADGTVLSIDTGEGINNGAFGINDNKEVVGTANFRAFSWTQATGLMDLGWGSTYSSAMAINVSGRIVGEEVVAIHTGSNNTEHAVVDGVDIHKIADISRATGVNNQGMVVGYANYQDPDGGIHGPTHGWIWDSTNGMQDLGFPPCPSTQPYVFPYAVNDQGFIVGVSCPFTPLGTIYTPFLWDSAHGYRDLNVLSGNKSGTARAAVGINKWGQIVTSDRRVLTPKVTVTLTGPSTTVVGKPENYSASVSTIQGNVPDGELVQFKLGLKIIATVPVTNGLASTSITFPYPAKAFRVSAMYVSNGIYAKASAGMPVTVVNP